MGRGGEYASPDDQGHDDTSTQHSLSKAVVDGFMRKIFVQDQEIDFDQSKVVKALLHESGRYDRSHRHSKYKKKEFSEWVSIHYPSPKKIEEEPEKKIEKIEEEPEGNKVESHTSPDPPPKEEAHPDDQGDLSTCTRHAVGKAVCDGYEWVWFDQAEKLDFLQREIVNTLIAVDGDAMKKEGTWPTHYDGLGMELLEDNFNYSGKAWKIYLRVAEVKKEQVMKSMTPDSNKSSTRGRGAFVLVYSSKNGPHCVYFKGVTKFPDTEPDYNVAVCVNSWQNAGQDYTMVNLDKVEHFYRIDCSAERRREEPRNSCWPTFFGNESSYKFTDISTKKTWKIRIIVKEVSKDAMIADMTEVRPSHTYLMVYNLDATSRSTHCVFVKEIIKLVNKNCALCLNSHKHDPYILLPLDQQIPNRECKFYSVFCEANGDI